MGICLHPAPSSMLVISLHTELVPLLSCVAPAIQNKGHLQLKLFTVLSGLKLDCLKVMAKLGKGEM